MFPGGLSELNLMILQTGEQLGVHAAPLQKHQETVGGIVTMNVSSRYIAVKPVYQLLSGGEWVSGDEGGLVRHSI